MDTELKNRDYSKKFWKLDAIRSVTQKYTQLYKNFESLIEKSTEKSPLLDSMLQFQESTGIESLHELTPGLTYSDSPESLTYFMQSLAPYYLSGFLFERGQQKDAWWATGFFFKGHWFDLELSDQIQLGQSLPFMSPLQVKKASTEKVLSQYKIDFMPVPISAECFLFRPTHLTGLMLFTESPELFAKLKIDSTLTLVNRYFNS